MAPILKDSPEDISPSGASRANAKSSQPVALEVAVSVNGARAIPGSAKREPFSENTSTVMVHANGAVIRLTSAVQPGQLLFLTNEKTHKEVVCQVVKSKSDRSSGYVELQFTEPVSGFWGLRFPTEASGPTSPSGIAQGSASTQKLPSSSVALERNSVPVPLAKPEITEQFKTEIKPEERHLSKADFLTPSESSAQAPKLDSSPLQEQLAALLAMDSIADQPASPEEATPLNTAEVAAQVLNIVDAPAATPAEPPTVSAAVVVTPVEEEPASPAVVPPPVVLPRAPKSGFDDDEVKIPAWLQPLARNESVPAPPTTDEDTPPATQESAPKPEASAPAKRHEPARKTVSSAAVFGNSLIGETPAQARSSSSGGKGIWIGAIAAVLVLAAGAGWYFRDSLFANQSSAAKQQSPAASPAPVAAPAAVSDSTGAPSSPNPDRGSLDSSSQELKSSASSSVSDSSSSSAAQPKLQTAAISERIPKTVAAGAKTAGNENEDSHIYVVEPEKRAPLGNVRLKKPKVGRASESDLKPELEPSLDGSQPAISSESMNSGLIGANPKEPSAPAPRIEVGGDVKVARMISSVAPVYPVLAKAQHISGEVRVDALIDATGRVTTMKVISGPPLLHQAAMDALRQWKYQPAMLDGKLVAMHLTVTIQFRLQ